MKIKSLLIGMLACSAMVACTNEDAPVNNGNDNQKGDAYVTVKLAMSGNAGSRAFQDGQFIDGENNEVAVNKAIFYFFDENGQGCADKFVMTNTANLVWADNSASIDEKSKAIVVIKNPVATPTSMLVLLNCEDPTNDMRPSLAQLQAVTKNTGDLVVTSGAPSVNYHIMSNAVYVNEGTVMVGTPITSDNITISANDKELGANDEGDKNVNGEDCVPVVVSVERLWAKVGMTPIAGYSEVLTPATEEADNDYRPAKKEYEIQATVTGWWLASKANKTYLIKNLSNKYEVAPFISTSTWWNDVNNKRSYWANMPTMTAGDYTNETTWSGANLTNESEYCLENTSNSVDGDINQNGPGTATQYAAKAILKLKNSEGKFVETTFVRWLNTIYTEADFFQMIANAYNNYRIQVGEGESLALYDLNGVAIKNGEAPINGVLGWNYNGKNNGETLSLENYEGIITVSDPANGQSFVKKVGEDVYETVTAAAIQEEIRTRIDKVLLWLNGRTYYYTDIIHNSDVKEVSSTLYGVVRNHFYTLNVTGLTGMGTPVPNPELPINPERPEDDEYSHISAEVQIFSYKKVPTQNVTLQ